MSAPRRPRRGAVWELVDRVVEKVKELLVPAPPLVPVPIRPRRR